MADRRAKAVDEAQAPAGVRSVLRAVPLLRAFTAERPHLPLGEFAERAALDMATARHAVCF